jgi:hypothetical protein
MTYFVDNAEATLHRDMMGGEEGRYGVGVHFSPTGQKVWKTQVDDSLFWDKDGNPRSAVAEKNANDAVDAAPGTHRLRLRASRKERDRIRADMMPTALRRRTAQPKVRKSLSRSVLREAILTVERRKRDFSADCCRQLCSRWSSA